MAKHLLCIDPLVAADCFSKYISYCFFLIAFLKVQFVILVLIINNLYHHRVSVAAAKIFRGTKVYYQGVTAQRALGGAPRTPGTFRKASQKSTKIAILINILKVLEKVMKIFRKLSKIWQKYWVIQAVIYFMGSSGKAL